MQNVSHTPLAAPLSLGVLLWALLGVMGLLLQAVVRLLPTALEPIVSGQLSWWQAVLLTLWVAFNAYAEGYRGFQKGFSPRVVARALYLATHPKPLHVILGPLFSMGLIHASPKRLRTSWILVLSIVAVVLVVRHAPQPWRGMIDAGVVVGLLWGMAAIGLELGRSWQRGSLLADPELPAHRLLQAPRDAA